MIICFINFQILFAGEKSYLDVKSPGIIPCKFNDKNDFNLNLYKIYNMSKNELADKGLQNYNIVKMQNSPESISKSIFGDSIMISRFIAFLLIVILSPILLFTSLYIFF